MVKGDDLFEISELEWNIKTKTVILGENPWYNGNQPINYGAINWPFAHLTTDVIVLWTNIDAICQREQKSRFAT